MQVGRLNAVAVAENWQLSMRSIANLAQSRVYHTEGPTVHVTCLQHVRRDAAHFAGLSATADPYFYSAGNTLAVMLLIFADKCC